MADIIHRNAPFRAVGRAHGLTEVGNEKLKPRKKINDKEGRQKAIRTAIEKYKAGHGSGQSDRRLKSTVTISL